MPRLRKAATVRRGDLVCVRWVDIIHRGNEDDPDNTESAPVMETFGLFVRWRRGPYVRELIISDTRSSEGFYGITAFPGGCVLSVEKAKIAEDAGS